MTDGAGGATESDASEPQASATTSEPACGDDEQLCDAVCVAVSDPLHCGGCATACATSEECELGVCVPRCDTQNDCEIGLACVLDACSDLSEGRGFGAEQSRASTYGTTPQVDVSAVGHGAVIWDATDTRELLVSRYLLAEGEWTAPVAAHMAPFPNSPDIGVDAAGNVVAAWQQGGNDFRDVWVNRYDAAQGAWQGPELIEPEATGFADEPVVVLDAAGNATVTWRYSDEAGGGRVQVNRYSVVDGAWGSAVDLTPHLPLSPDNVTAIGDARGNVLVSWVQVPTDKEYNDTLVAHYDIETDSWSEALAIDAHDRGHTNHPNLTVDGQGNYFAAWHQTGDEVTHVWANRYDVSTGQWGTAQQIDIATDTDLGAIYGQVGADEHGNCLLVWNEEDLVMSALYDSATGQWATLGAVDTSADALEPRLVVDRGGRGIVLWPSASGQIYISRFDPQSRAWSARQAVDPVHADRTSDPSLDIDAQGRAIAAWHEIGESGSWEVMTNRFE